MVPSHPSFPIDRLEALESMVVPVPFREGSSRSVENQNLPSPVHVEEEEDVVRDFWTVGETPKYIIHAQVEEPRVETPRRRVIQEVFVGSVAIHLDGDPPRFDAIPPDRNSRIVTPQP